MSTAYTHQDSNVRKTWFLMAVFFALVVGLGYFISTIYANPSILYVAIIFSVLMNIFSYWYSDKIVLSMSKAKEAKREEYTELYRVVENLAITAGLPLPRIYIIEDNSPNAFATGRNKEHAVIAVTTGLLQILEKNELEGVVAHELAHIGNRDILLQTIVVVLVGFVSILADIFLRSGFGGGNKKDSGKAGGILMIVGVVFIILSPIFAKLIQLAISRKREFLADASSALLTRYPEGLASALQKISGTNIPMQNAHKATAHLFISSPFAGVKSFSNLFSTHPPIENRIQALMGTQIETTNQ
jgi:heat shock protein HtpX